jgi:predicted ATPase
MTRETFFILTGPPGSGKSAVLEHLRTLGLPVIAEPARQILAEQRSIDGNGLPERDLRLFVDLMLSRAIYEYRRLDRMTDAVLFDRSIPDMLGYARHFGFEHPPARNAISVYRCNPLVFFAPSWAEIYTTDEERTLSFEASREFGDVIRAVYEESGYRLLDLPRASVGERAHFILRHIGQ